MKLLFDTDVILDLLLDRTPHSATAAQLLSRVEKGEAGGYICATAVTTIFYLASKAIGGKKARQHLRGLLSILEIAPVNRTIIANALDSGFSDFEDAVIHEAARAADLDTIVTRNTRDFRKATMPVYAPADLLSLIRAGDGGDK